MPRPGDETRHLKLAQASEMARKRPIALTDQQRVFVMEYLVDLNATEAAIRAGYSPNTAKAAASQLMRKGSPTQIAVARAMAERSARTGVTADRVIREVARVAFGDPRVLFREDGALRPPHEYNEDDAAMIEGVKTRRIVEVAMDADGKQKLVPVEIQEVKLASKMGALQALMRHLGLNNDKLDVTLNIPLAQRMADAYKRLGKGSLQQAVMRGPDGQEMEVEYEIVEGEEPEGEEPKGEEPAADALSDDELLARLLR